MRCLKWKSSAGFNMSNPLVWWFCLDHPLADAIPGLSGYHIPTYKGYYHGCSHISIYIYIYYIFMILYYITLHYIRLYYIILYYIRLYYIILYYIILYYIILYYIYVCILYIIYIMYVYIHRGWYLLNNPNCIPKHQPHLQETHSLQELPLRHGGFHAPWERSWRFWDDDEMISPVFDFRG